MSRLDELRPDQRAALSLLLRQRKRYDEVAALLGIPERAVHDRAHAAIAVLAPRQARALAAEQRAQIADYLLSQQDGVAERLATRGVLAASEPARAWALEIARELAPLADGPLAEIPPAAAPPSAAAGGAPSASVAREPASTAPAEHRLAAPEAALPSSRLGGALVLAGIVAAVVVAVVLLTSGGSSHTTKTKTTSTSKTATNGPKIEQRVALKSPNPSSSAIALVEILSEGGKRAFYIAAEHLPPSRGFFYVIWLYNSASSSEPLSRAPSVGSNGRMAGGSFLPSNASSFRELIVTRETASRPTHPGPIALRGAFTAAG
jgi:hypothetical protein